MEMINHKYLTILNLICFVCDSRSLKCVLEYGLGGFSVVWGGLGVFHWT